MTDLVLQVGKTYVISPKWKKTLIEIEVYAHADGRRLNTEKLWRAGSFEVTIKDEEELKELNACLTDGTEWQSDNFESFELLDAWDGISSEFVFYGSSFSAKDKNALTEEYEAQLEGDDWEDMYEFLCSKGYEPVAVDYIIYSGIEVEE